MQTAATTKKGEYEAHFDDLRFRLQNCLIIWLGYLNANGVAPEDVVDQLAKAFKERLWIGIESIAVRQ